MQVTRSFLHSMFPVIMGKVKVMAAYIRFSGKNMERKRNLSISETMHILTKNVQKKPDLKVFYITM